MSFVYLAHPYTHPDPAVMESRFQSANRIAGYLMQRGLIVFSPISHTHPIACCCDLPRGWVYWHTFDRLYLDAASAMYVVMAEGWQKSKGIAGEIEIMHSLRKSIRYLTPEHPNKLWHSPNLPSPYEYL